MTIQTLARLPLADDAETGEDREHHREAYYKQRQQALAAYDEALQCPEALDAAAVRTAATASDGKTIDIEAARWMVRNPHSLVRPANVPGGDQTRFIFHVQVIRELAPERQKRLARRLGDVVALGADALQSMPIDAVRTALEAIGKPKDGDEEPPTCKPLPIRRVRDAIFALRVYRAAIAAPASVDNPLRMLNLFAGIDAATYAASLIGDGKRIQTVAVAEVEPYPIAVMRRHYPQVPNLGDVTKIDWQKFTVDHGQIDILTAGFPCQDFSRAGGGEGLEGAKSSLFREAMRAAASLRPRYIVLENVAALFDSNHRADFLRVVRACKKAGYALDIAGLEAMDFGLPMLRPRFYAVGIRRDLAKWLPRRKAWRYHDVAPVKTKVEMIDKGLLRRLGQNLDTRTDIGEALENARWLREDGSRVRRPRFSLLGGYLTAHHVPQPSWLGDMLDREPSPSLDLDGEDVWETMQKWDAVARSRDNDEDDEGEEDGDGPGALYELAAMRAAAERHEAISKGKSNGAPLDLTGITYPIAHGIAHTLHQRGMGYSLGGLGIRPHSMYTLTTHSGFAVVHEDRPRLLSHDEQDKLMGFPPGYSYVAQVLGKGGKGKPRAPSKNARQKAIGNSMAVPCIGAALEGVLIAEMCLRGM